MSLSQRLREYVDAAVTGIWIQSHEHSDALREITQLCRDKKWAPATWDVDRGMSSNGQTAANASDLVAAVRALNTLATPNGSALLVLPQGRWWADLSPVKGPKLGPFNQRRDALTAETKWLDEDWLTRGGDGFSPFHPLNTKGAEP